jgi:hypothetical protein
MLVRTRMLGPVAYPVDPAVVDKNASLLNNPDRQELRSTTLVWPALLRKLDRLDGSYRN